MMHRILTTLTWVKRLQRFTRVTALSMELAKFDTQKIQNPEILEIKNKQGELESYEVREYLLEKWGRKCTYCGAQGVRLQIDHIHPRSRVGSNRVGNLCLACVPCNLAKGNQDIEKFLAGKPKLLNRIKAEVKTPLKDAAAINTTRSALLKALEETGLPVETGTGGQTKYNRSRLGLPKTHWLDAACIGTVDELKICTSQPLLISCKGHGNRQMTNVNKHGFPRAKSKEKPWGGWKTGDLVKLVKPNGQKFVARLLVGAIPSKFEIRINKERIRANPKTNQLICIQKRDGYDYSL